MVVKELFLLGKSAWSNRAINENPTSGKANWPTCKSGNFIKKLEKKLLEFNRFSKTVVGIILRFALIWSNTIKHPMKKTIKKASILFLRNLEAWSCHAEFILLEGSSSSQSLSEPLWSDK